MASSLPAAARRCSTRRRAADAVADAGAVRPARGARRAASASRAFLTRRAPRRPTRSTPRACATTGRAELADELERAAGRLRARAGGVRRDATATCSARSRRTPRGRRSATHAVLPLLATDAGVRLQLRTGIAAHRARFGALGRRLLAARVRARAVARRAARGGRRARDVRRPDRRLRPRRRAPPAPARAPTAGPLLVPIDRETIELVWSDDGYPSHGAYRDYHHHTTHHHKPWANDGAAYDRDARAGAGAGRRARDFVARASRERAAPAAGCACARSTPSCSGTGGTRASTGWRVVVEEARAGLSSCASTTRSSDEPAPAPGSLPVTTLGHAARPVDLERAARSPTWRSRRAPPSCAWSPTGGARRRARRCASCSRCRRRDWAFLTSREAAGPYARERHDGHLAALDTALAAGGDDAVRNLAPKSHTRAAARSVESRHANPA